MCSQPNANEWLTQSPMKSVLFFSNDALFFPVLKFLDFTLMVEINFSNQSIMNPTHFTCLKCHFLGPVFHNIIPDDYWSCIASRQTSCCFATASACYCELPLLSLLSLCGVCGRVSLVSRGRNKSQWKGKWAWEPVGNSHVRRLNFTAQPLTTFTHFSSNCP